VKLDHRQARAQPAVFQRACCGEKPRVDRETWWPAGAPVIGDAAGASHAPVGSECRDCVVGMPGCTWTTRGRFGRRHGGHLKGELESGEVVDRRIVRGEAVLRLGRRAAAGECTTAGRRNQGSGHLGSPDADFDEYLQVKVLPAPARLLQGLPQVGGEAQHSHISHGCVMYHALCGGEGTWRACGVRSKASTPWELLPYLGRPPLPRFPGRTPTSATIFSGIGNF